MTRTFDAPRAFVFDALTKPELVRQWFGPPPDRGWSVATCEADLTAGGSWRIVMRRSSPMLTEMVLSGTYSELVPPERIVATQLMQGCTGQGSSEAIATTVLADFGSTTLFSNTMRYPSRSVRDAVLGSGVSQAEMAKVYEKLAVMLSANSQQNHEGA